ncbi:type II toxin-antitoxin system VapC family toxin [Ciceribacter sp. L1K23]|uniref:type II toxin-antitoxin system VapC family toxin n=1 Tax=Ciceribacter sp. L1K23 TaxID=2820276 RepID=UPI001B846587|nr:type II toxin-antitoxin system VapC family toxin [Ciceribacter sp. L1K23]MBR0555301.1 type II toxin-antitoxin system VapC family toxin [Ciceribacter sp. L1K23]
MIIVDTNILSELLRPQSDPGVLRWMDTQVLETLFLTTISLAELRYGIAKMPEGQRKAGLATAFEKTVKAVFDNRFLVFDEAAAKAYATLMSVSRSKGRAIAIADGYIAAIAASRNFDVATRDTSPFEAAGLTVINPWHHR